MDDEKPIPEPKHSIFAVWHWPRDVLWIIVFLAAIWAVARIDDLYNRHQIAARRAKIGPATSGPLRPPFPARDWEDKLMRNGDLP